LSSTNTKAVDSDVELRRDGFQVVHLVIPIRLKDGDVRATKDHFGMIAKRRFGDLGVVLGTDGENDSPFLELLGVILQGKMGFAGCASLAEDDAVESVVPDHAAPKGVVEIEHQAFLRQSALRGQHAGDEIAIEGRCLRSYF
jgi:hypothetical protein